MVAVRSVKLTIGQKRLLKLAKKLDTIPDVEFNFAHWVSQDHYSFSDFLVSQQERVLVNNRVVLSPRCGFAGCAIGWAGSMPEFRRDGLFLDDKGLPGYTVYWGLEAISMFFDLDSRDTKYLFMPVGSGLGDGATPKQVAEHIRGFVKCQAR